jgi:hypothetical protein
VDVVIKEPRDGAHTDLAATSAAIKKAILASLARLDKLAPDDLRAARYARLRTIGTVLELEAEALRGPSPSFGERLGRLFGVPAGAPSPEAEDDDLDEEGA